MPRFYFDLHNGSGLTKDVEGQELPDEVAARASAQESIRSLLSSEVREGLLDLRGWIDIRFDLDGRSIKVGFADAVQLWLPDGGYDDRASSHAAAGATRDL